MNLRDLPYRHGYKYLDVCVPILKTMKKLTTALLLFSCLLYTKVNAQTNPPKNPVDSSLMRLSKIKFDAIRKKLIFYEDTTNQIYEDKKNKHYLISRYSFRSLIQQDYSKITIGENSFSKVGRFATLQIDEDGSKFYFTPFVFVVRKDPQKGDFKYIHSIDVSGEMSKKVFDFKNKKTLKAGYSLTLISKKTGYKYLPNSRNESFHREMVHAAFVQTKRKYENATTSFADYLDIADEVEKTDSTKVHKGAKKRFFKTLEEMELKYYEEKWSAKRIGWFKLNVTPFSWDNFKHLDPQIASSLSKPIDKSVYTGNIKLSYNQLYTRPSVKNFQFYWSAFVALSRKHSLSEISKPSQWYNLKKLTDSTSTVTEDESVFSMTSSEFKSRLRPDIGAQVIFLFDVFNDTNIGIDLTSSFKGLVTTSPDSYVNNTLLGLIIPFKDKEGNNSINFELFYERKSYLNASLKNAGFWGIKFGLPFTTP